MINPRDAISTFVANFGSIHREDPRTAYTALIGAFVACFSMLTAEHRVKSMAALGLLLKDMGGEIFEDGQDLLSFLKEKVGIDKESES